MYHLPPKMITFCKISGKEDSFINNDGRRFKYLKYN